MHAMTITRCLVLETRFGSEPASWLDRLLPSLRPLVEAVAPTWMFVCSPQGRVSRDRKIKWQTVEELAALSSTGSIRMREQEGASLLTIDAYLRHNPAIELEFQAPAAIWLGVEGTSEHLLGLLAAFSDFLAFAATVPDVLHGGITVLDNLAQAESEVTGTGTDVDQQPLRFVRRHEHDWRYPKRAWTALRRLYWATLLGPKFAAAAGGASAARVSGALNIQETDDSLLFQAMEGPPRDSLDPEFLAATTRLRRWLWPHTFQNPLDAAGFEDEVGLPTPGATDVIR